MCKNKAAVASYLIVLFVAAAFMEIRIIVCYAEFFAVIFRLLLRFLLMAVYFSIHFRRYCAE